MKKRLIVFLLIFLLVFLTGCMSTSQPEAKEYVEYSIEDVLALDFNEFESLKISIPYQIDEDNFSFEIKEIIENEDRKKVYDFLNTAKMTEDKDREEKMGFDGLIEIKSVDEIFLVFVDNLVLINNKKYYISEEDLGALLGQLYAEMDYEIEKLE